jgi:hypothetical protein
VIHANTRGTTRANEISAGREIALGWFRMALYTVHGQSHGHAKIKGPETAESRIPKCSKGGYDLQVIVTRKPNAA